MNPFSSKKWLASAHQWIIAHLDDAGIRIIADMDQFHVRDWSTVIRIPTNKGNLYFKAGAEGQRFEAAFLEKLVQIAPEQSMHAIAVDSEKGWLLIPDGGQTLREFESGQIDKSNWSKLLSEFGLLQIKLIESANEFVGLGLPDNRSEVLREQYPLVLEAKSILMSSVDDSLSEEEFERLLNKQKKFESLLGNLAAFGIPNSIEHGDLHDANVFINDGKLIFFDWGDASLSHPFISLMIPLRVLGNRLNLEPETHPDLEWARRAYFEVWTDFLPIADLQKVWELALHVGRFQRSLTWYKIAMHEKDKQHSQYDSHFSGWIRDFIYHPEIPPS